jgi:hypothetical protein
MRRDLAGSSFFAAIILTMVAMVFIAISGGNVWAADAAYVSKNLPRAYSGTFQWHEGGDPQKVVITIGRVSTSDAGDVMAGGKGQYVTANGTTDILVYMIILPEKLLVKIFERDPKGSSTFQVGGSHVGRLSQDLKTIQAVWTSNKDGKKGDLVLKARMPNSKK